MPKIIYRLTDGKERVVDVESGTSVMRAALENDVPGLIGECGGQAMCATCHVYVDESWTRRLPAIGDDEDALLDGAAAERLANSRLSCQINMAGELDGLVLRLPDRQI